MFGQEKIVPPFCGKERTLWWILSFEIYRWGYFCRITAFNILLWEAYKCKNGRCPLYGICCPVFNTAGSILAWNYFKSDFYFELLTELLNIWIMWAWNLTLFTSKAINTIFWWTSMNMLNFWQKACLPKDSFDGMIVK